MLFNSLDFAVFFPIVFILYWFVFNRNLRNQNAFLLIASYFFYGWWDWKFLFLMGFSSLVDFIAARSLHKSTNNRRRKIYLAISIIINLGFLGVFKYYNFFIENFSQVFTLFGQNFSAERLNIILPVGISFYTFQTMSYSIDVYRKKLIPSSDFISFFAFVSFFPQLVAGPIERATNLLPQFHVKRIFDYNKAADGMRQILWGLFKKIVIADNCAIYVDTIYSTYTEQTGINLLFGTFFFAIQIYCDFSGYSDIAIGSSRLLGFTLMKNFAFPYFSRDIAEFWRRWHISLSTWFRDYVYIPLGGSKGNAISQVRNVFLIFLISGFWHGANWTFILWGAVNALYFLPLLLLKSNRSNLNIIAEHGNFPKFREFTGMIATFILVLLAWVFFRSENLSQAFEILKRIFSWSLFQSPEFNSFHISTALLLSLIIGFIGLEWNQRKNHYGFEKVFPNNTLFRHLAYMTILFLIFNWGQFTKTEFIYFQF